MCLGTFFILVLFLFFALFRSLHSVSSHERVMNMVHSRNETLLLYVKQRFMSISIEIPFYNISSFFSHLVGLLKTPSILLWATAPPEFHILPALQYNIELLTRIEVYKRSKRIPKKWNNFDTLINHASSAEHSSKTCYVNWILIDLCEI